MAYREKEKRKEKKKEQQLRHSVVNITPPQSPEAIREGGEDPKYAFVAQSLQRN